MQGDPSGWVDMRTDLIKKKKVYQIKLLVLHKKILFSITSHTCAVTQQNIMTRATTQQNIMTRTVILQNKMPYAATQQKIMTRATTQQNIMTRAVIQRNNDLWRMHFLFAL